MKKNLLLSILMLLALLVVFVGCKNSVDSENSDGETLDLRIKNGSEYYVSRSVSQEGTTSGEYIVTDHVKARTVTGGIEFTISCPTDDCYEDGFGSVLVYRIENGDNTTGALLGNAWDSNDTIIFVYPLCEAGEKYRFKVQIEPMDVSSNRDFQYYEYIDIVATDGIGDINYSNIRARKWVSASYSNGKSSVKIENCIPPEAQDVKTYIDFFAGNKDWETDNATCWIKDYTGSGIELEIKPSDSWISEFNTALEEANCTYSNQFFAQYSFRFTIKGCDAVTRWTTKAIESDIVYVR